MSFEDKFYQFSETIKNIGLEKKTFKDSLAWGELYGRVLYTNYSNLYRDDDFEKELISRYLKENRDIALSEAINEDLHIISEAYSTGGHTRLLERMVTQRGLGDVLVTRSISDLSVLKLPSFSKVFAFPHKLDMSQILSISSKYKRVFLHIHPDDLTTAVAMGVLKRLSRSQIIFVNHADHIFSFGYFSSSVVAEMGPFGDKLKQEKNRGESIYLGLPFKFERFNKVRKRELKENLLIVSGGTSFKFSSAGGLSFSRLVTDILAAIPKANFVVIGPDKSMEWWWPLFKFSKRLKVIPKLPYEEYQKLMKNADVYIDSFPLSGGTTIPEVRATGIPITGVMCGSYGYTPWDKTKYDSNEELVSALKEFAEKPDSELYFRNNDSKLIDECENIHSLSRYKERLMNLVGNGTGEQACFTHEVNFDYFYLHWLAQKRLNLGKKSYLFLIANWNSGGKEIMTLAIKINPLKYVTKLIGGALKNFSLAFKINK